MKDLRILLLSGVRHGASYAATFRGLRGVELVGVAEQESAPAWALQDSAALASRFELPLVDLEDGIEQSDAVIVCSEPTRHVQLAVLALSAGRHVLMDKPAALRVEEARALEKAVQAAPTMVLTAIHRLGSPSVRRARRLIDDGEIGLPLLVSAEWIAAGGLDGTSVERAELVCDPALSGGGELVNFGWYPFLAIPYLTGLAVEEVSVFARSLFGGPHRHYGVEDSAVLSLGLHHGATATLMVTRAPVGVSNLPLSSRMTIVGSHGAIVIDEDAPYLQLRTGTTVERRTLCGPSGEYAIQSCAKEFVAAIRGETGVTVGIREILDVAAVFDACRASNQDGKSVKVQVVEDERG